MKKFLAVIIAVIVCMEIIPMQFMPVIQAAPKAEMEEYSSDFIKNATKLMNENWEDDYFSVIKMEIGDSHMLVDGEEKESDAVVERDGGLSFPLEDIAEQIGEELEPVENAENPEINDGKVELSLHNKVEMIEDNNGAEVPYRIMEEENSESSSEVEYSKEDTEEALGVNIEVNENEVIITKPYQTKQIVLKVSGDKELDNTQNAKEFVTDGNGLYLLQYESEEDTKNAYEQFLHRNDLEYVTINKVMHKTAMNWGTERISAELYQERLKSKNITSEELLVAVVDTGVDHSHPKLEGRVREDLSYDFVDGDEVAEDVDGHGTHVSGIIADCSTDNIKIIPIKVLDDDGYGTFLAVSMGISYAVTNGAKVINLSLAGEAWDDNDVDYQAVKKATEKGVLCVAAAGNSASDTKYFTPARSPYAVTVAATDSDDLIASFSNYGEAVDIAAPGVNIYSSISGNNYASWSGTSMAAPHVVGAAAMFLVEYPNLTPAELKDKLKETSVDCAMPGQDIEYGAGVLDFRVFLGEKVDAENLTLNVEEIDGSTSLDDIEGWKLNAIVEPQNATNKSVTYASSDKNVAEYKNGNVYAVSEGTAVITATLSTGVAKNCTVNVAKSNDWLTAADSSFAGGDGTRDNPYLISTAGQLAKLLSDVNVSNITYKDQYFRQTADIDLGGRNWIPIGYRSGGYTYYPEFEYDGGGFAVKNMKIETSKDFVGFFALNGRALKNINLVDADINGKSNVGGIAGNNLGVIANCYVGGKIEGNYSVGAITGVSYNVNYLLIMDCNSDATVKARIDTDRVGGLVGILGSDIYNSYFNGKIESPNGQGGGIAGNFDSWNKRYDSYDIRNDVTVEGRKVPYKIVNCFADGNLVGTKEDGMIINSYYTASSPTRSDESPSLTQAEKKSVSFFTTESTFHDQSNWYGLYPWNMDASWSMKEGEYPKLRKPVYGSGNPDFSYRELNGYIEITKYKGNEKDVVIPEEINQKPVLSIDWFAFEEEAALQVESIFIPKSMININEYAIADAPNLININVDPENPMYSSENGVLYSKDMSTLVTYPSGRTDTSFTMPSSVKITGSYAFTRTKVTEVQMSENLEEMRPGTFFYNEHLKKVIFTEAAPKDLAVTAIDQDTRPVLYYMEGKEGWRGTKLINCELKQVIVGNIEGSPASGIVDAGTKVTLKTTSNADIYYTTDGIDPTKSSTKYEQPITLNEDTVIKAVTIDSNDVKGDVATFRYRMSYIPQTPKITQQPKDLLLPYREEALLTVNAKVDKGYLKYQWYKINRYGAEIKISGATQQSYDASGSNGETLRYYCVITNTDLDSGSKNGVSIKSRAAEVGVLLHYQDPTSITRELNGSATLNVGGTIWVGDDQRSHELSYQWYKTKENDTTGGTKIEGANKNEYQAPTDRAGKSYYYCVTDRTYETSEGTKNTISYKSETASVIVKNEDGSDPIIVGNIEANPGSGVVDAGTKITLETTVDADIYYTTDESDPTKSSTKYEEPITINKETVIKAVTIDSDDVIGDVATFRYKMSYIPETPKIMQQPEDLFLPYGEQALLTVNATVEKGSLKYQWYKIDRYGAEIKVDNATESTFDASDSNGETLRYYCVITNYDVDSGNKEGVSIKSRTADAGVLLHYQDPTSLSVEFKGSATLDVKGTIWVGDDQRMRELSYQWYETEENTNTGGTKIEGANKDKYKPLTDEAGKTYYYCVIDRTYETSEGTQNTISYKSKAAYVIVEHEVVDRKIEASPASGIVDAGTKITLKTAASADIYYTTDETDPTESSTKYEEPITINKETVIKAVTIDGNGVKGEIATFQFKISYTPEMPKIIDQPEDLFLPYKEQAPLTVSAKVDKGELTYQWYKINSDGAEEKLNGATMPTFDASANNGATYRYYCVITNHDVDSGSDKGVSIKSRTAEVGILLHYQDPASLTVKFKEQAILNVQGTIYVGDDQRIRELSYQWYKAEENTNSDGVKIEGANQIEYQAPTNKAGKTHYYCVISRTYETPEGTNNTISYKSKAAYVIVNEEESKEVPANTSVTPVEKLTAQSVSYNSIKLKWSKTSKITGYELWRAESKSGKYKLQKKVTSKNTTTFTDTKCVTGKTYYYKIRAYVVSNKKTTYSKFSKVVSKKAELSKPSFVRAKNVSKKAVKLEWKKLKGASGYQIYRGMAKNGKYKLIKTTKGQGYSFTDRTVTKNKSYYYKIRAYRKVGNKTVRSPYSVIKMVKVTK